MDNRLLTVVKSFLLQKQMLSPLYYSHCLFESGAHQFHSVSCDKRSNNISQDVVPVVSVVVKTLSTRYLKHGEDKRIRNKAISKMHILILQKSAKPLIVISEKLSKPLIVISDFG